MKQYPLDRRAMKNLREIDQVFVRKCLHVFLGFFYQIYHVCTCAETTEYHSVHTGIHCTGQHFILCFFIFMHGVKYIRVFLNCLSKLDTIIIYLELVGFYFYFIYKGLSGRSQGRLTHTSTSQKVQLNFCD